MKHYITGYNIGEDTQIVKILLPLRLAELREIMSWPDDSFSAYDNELDEIQARKIGEASGIQLPYELDLFLTTESSGAD